MKIILEDVEASSYLKLQSKVENLTEALSVETAKFIAAKNEITSLKSLLDSNKTIFEDNAHKIATLERDARVNRDSELAHGIEATPAKTVPEWMKPKPKLIETVEEELSASTSPKPYSRWTKVDTQKLKDFILLDGIHGPECRTLVWLAAFFDRDEQSIKNKVYTLFNGTRPIRNGKITQSFKGIK